MATEAAVSALKEAIQAALEYEGKELVRRGEWGSISFENAEADIRRTFSVLNHLNVLPLEHLTDGAVNNIQARISEVQTQFQNIDTYNIEQGNPTQVRDNLVNQFHGQSDAFYDAATPWIPFLAYQQGDVAKNINALTKSVQDAVGILEGARNDIEGKKGEIDDIINKAREASASAGAAVFTQDFSKAAGDLEKEATKWLRATALFAGGTLAFALLLLFIVRPSANALEATQYFGAKLAVLIVLFTATFWCGANYKALRHQAANNRHRALALQTFQAFSAAASDEMTKNAVLIETTRSIFANTATGYIGGASSQDGSSQVVEVFKSVLDRGQGNNA